MKKRSILSILITIIICYGLYQVYVFYFDNNDNIQSIYLVPKDAVYVIETEEPVDGWDAISDSPIWKHLQQNDYFNNLTKNLNKLDTVFKQKQGLFNKIGNRELLVSAHVYDNKKYGFLYVVDLQKIAKLNLLKSNLNTLVNNNYKVTKRKYHNHEITELYDVKKRQTLYISFIKNQMITSYVHTLVEASIDQYTEPQIGRNLDFLEVKKQVDDDLFKLYFQYDYLDDFVKVFSNQPSYLTTTLSNSLEWSAFSFKFNENSITANGVTNTKENASTYLRALQKSGKGNRTISKIAPKQTAFYLSFAFSSFSDFYSNFENIQKENPERFKTYLDGTEQVENFLKINLKAHFMSWIDDEMAILQMQSSVSQSSKDIALVLKTKNIKDAKENLDFILSQIKKRSPVKFKAVNYKEHTINFMSIKGFFKVLLGGLFEELEKPYFTIIEDYVVFSNNPNTLKTIIKNYVDKNTLNTFEDFNDFEDQFETRSSIFAYVNTPSLYNNTYAFVDNATKKDLTTNKDYFICFPQIGLQLTPENDFFESKVVMHYESPELVKAKYTFTDTFTPTKLVGNESAIHNEDLINEATIFNIPEIYPTDLTAKEFTQKYANGNTRFSVELKDGLKHGRYKAYYQNGVLKISGRYKKDKQISIWRVYNMKEDLMFKKRF